MMIVVHSWNRILPQPNSGHSVGFFGSNGVGGKGGNAKCVSVYIVFCGPVEDLDRGFQDC
jgi:hypothetical protein